MELIWKNLMKFCIKQLSFIGRFHAMLQSKHHDPICAFCYCCRIQKRWMSIPSCILQNLQKRCCQNIQAKSFKSILLHLELLFYFHQSAACYYEAHLQEFDEVLRQAPLFFNFRLRRSIIDALDQIASNLIFSSEFLSCFGFRSSMMPALLIASYFSIFGYFCPWQISIINLP